VNGVDFPVVWAVMKWPLAACLILPPLLVYLGLHVVKREVIFVDLALAQVATLGTCVALIMGYDFHDRIAFWISLGVTFIAAALFSWSRGSREHQVPQEAIIGITFVVAAAGVILLLSRVAGGKEELEHLLTGDILNVTSGEVGQRALIFVALGGFYGTFHRRFALISSDPAQAFAQGLRGAVTQVIAHQRASHGPQRFLHGRNLHQDVRAVAVAFDHFLQAAHLALDAAQALQV